MFTCGIMPFRSNLLKGMINGKMIVFSHFVRSEIKFRTGLQKKCGIRNYSVAMKYGQIDFKAIRRRFFY